MLAPALTVGLLLGSFALPSAGAQRCAACRPAAMACHCCPTSPSSTVCDMACCRAPQPLPQRTPTEPTTRVEREPVVGKMGWINAELPLGAAESQRLGPAFAAALPSNEGASLIAQHVRLQI